MLALEQSTDKWTFQRQEGVDRTLDLLGYRPEQSQGGVDRTLRPSWLQA